MDYPQQPDATQPGIQVLEDLLAQGWQIEAPVLARHSWARRESNTLDYHVIIAHGSRRSLVVLPQSRALIAYCAERQLQVSFPATQVRPLKRLFRSTAHERSARH